MLIKDEENINTFLFAYFLVLSCVSRKKKTSMVPLKNARALEYERIGDLPDN
jgi:hypothetical protein